MPGVLAMEPEILVADEATAMLDPFGRRDVLETVRRLNKEKGITVVWITHYMEEAVQADRILVVSDGQIVKEGTPREIFRQVDALRELHLDVPPHDRLERAAPRGRHAFAGRSAHRGRNGRGGGKAAMPIEVRHLTHTYSQGQRPSRPPPSWT